MLYVLPKQGTKWLEEPFSLEYLHSELEMTSSWQRQIVNLEGSMWSCSETFFLSKSSRNQLHCSFLQSNVRTWSFVVWFSPVFSLAEEHKSMYSTKSLLWKKKSTVFGSTRLVERQFVFGYSWTLIPLFRVVCFKSTLNCFPLFPVDILLNNDKM